MPIVIRYGEIEKIMYFLEQPTPEMRLETVDKLILHPLESEVIRGLIDDRLFAPSPKTINSVLKSKGYDLRYLSDSGTLQRSIFNGRYEPTIPLAVNSDTIVYRAIQQRPFMRNVAVREYLNDDLRFPYSNIHREMQKHSTLNHPGFASLLDGGFDVGKGSSTVHQIVDGISILNYVLLARPDYQSILKMIAQVASILEFIRHQGISDLPLMPSKFMVFVEGDQPRIKYTGFCPEAFNPRHLFSNRESLCSQKDLFCQAPETLTKDSLRTDTGSDIYFLGGLFYLLITGINPLKNYGSAMDSFDEYYAYVKKHKPMTVSHFCSLSGLKPELMNSMDGEALVFVSDSISEWTRIQPEKRPGSPEVISSKLRNEILRIHYNHELISRSNLANRGKSRSHKDKQRSALNEKKSHGPESFTNEEKFITINRRGKYVALAIGLLALFFGLEMVRDDLNKAMNEYNIINSFINIIGFLFVYRSLSREWIK